MGIDLNVGIMVKGNDGKLKIKDKKYKEKEIGDYIDNPKLKGKLKEGDEVRYMSFTTEGEIINVIKEKKKT
jgi:hypothetical protein